MADSIPKDCEIVPKLSRIDEAILMVTESHPDWSQYQVNQKLQDLGVTANKISPYQNLKKNEYLTKKIEEIKAHHRETLSRILVPEAIKVAKKALKSDMDPKDKLGYVKLTLDKEFGEDRSPVTHIDKIEVGQIQVLIQQSLEGK